VSQVRILPGPPIYSDLRPDRPRQLSLTTPGADVVRPRLAGYEQALKNEAWLLSAYDTSVGRCWIIAEAERSSTCVLLPSEY
jgi:hypothetical protein